MAIQVTDLHLLRDQLVFRRKKLEAAVARSHTANLVQLLEQVDKALERVNEGSFGVCEACHGTVEPDRLFSDPLARVCLDCLPPDEQRALERDLELAARIQSGLLPPQDFSAAGWKVAYHYDAAGLVSGDYCDVLAHGRDLYFMLGDVSGKGVAASMLMANLHAMFRVLIPTGLPLEELVARANRIFCGSTLPTQYATLIVGKAKECGEVEFCNGGHLAPLHVSQGGVRAIESSTLPVGLFHDQEFVSTKISVSPGDSLVLYTDGFTEALGQDGAEYGEDRLRSALRAARSHGPRQLTEACVQDVLAYRASSRKHDDQTLLALQFAPLQH
jgi:sigma-B regulation protein RsbU (phosphoserine phosphatase)